MHPINQQEQTIANNLTKLDLETTIRPEIKKDNQMILPISSI